MFLKDVFSTRQGCTYLINSLKAKILIKSCIFEYILKSNIYFMRILWWIERLMDLNGPLQIKSAN